MLKGFDRLIKFYLQKAVLRFRGDLEPEFNKDYNNRSVASVRIAIILGFLLYSLFGVLDIFIAPISRNYIWFIRYAVVCPILAIIFILTFFSFFTRLLQPFMCIAATMAGAGIVVMIAIVQPEEPAYNYYYAGLILVIMWSYTFIRLRFIYAAIVCWLIVVSYEFSGIFLQNMLSNFDSRIVFINNNFFFISANVMGMFINLLFEVYFRKDFLQRRLIEEKQKQLEDEKDELLRTNELIKTELNMARVIQQHLIPQKSPDQAISSFYKPMEEVGGDFYDFISFYDKNKLGIFLSDVSGHGVPAAFITSMVKSTLVQAKHLQDNPAKMLKQINELLVEETEGYFVTAFYGVYDRVERSLLFCSAGHNPPYICHHGKVFPLSQTANHLPLGIFDNDVMIEKDTRYNNTRVVLPSKSKLILYTDGLVEARGDVPEKGDFEDIVEHEIIRFSPLKPEEFIKSLYGSLTTFRGGEQFDDDICIICMNIP